jgi:hypothetical protein
MKANEQDYPEEHHVISHYDDVFARRPGEDQS